MGEAGQWWLPIFRSSQHRAPFRSIAAQAHLTVEVRESEITASSWRDTEPLDRENAVSTYEATLAVLPGGAQQVLEQRGRLWVREWLISHLNYRATQVNSMVWISPSMLAMLLKDYARWAETSCQNNVQAANLLLITSALWDAFVQSGAQDIPEAQDVQADLYRAAEYLMAQQNLDGGWGWWPGDISRPLHTAQALDAVLDLARSGELASTLPVVRDERIGELEAARREVMQLGHRATMERLGIELRIGDARDLHLDEPADLVTSNTVLEHIDPEVLVGILVAFRLNSRPGTVMSHLVDLCDHYAYVEDTVDVYQFLTFDERRWRWIDNSLQPMNRLRVHQYRELYEAAGVPITEEQRGEGAPEDLAGVELAPPFDSMDPRDVACKSVLLVTRF